MEEYKAYIEELAEHNKNVVFFNSGPEHASLVMENIFRSSRHDIRIFAGYMSGEVSDKENYKSGLTDFFQRGGKIRILLQSDKKIPEKEPPIFKLLKFFSLVKPGSVEVKESKRARVFQADDKTAKEIHFTTGDDRMYRIEDDISSFSASGNFNDPETVKSLNAMFDEMYKQANVVSL